MKTLLKLIKRKYDFQVSRDPKIQLVNAVAELRAGVPHKALERHAVEVSRLRGSLSGNAKGGQQKLKDSIVCNFTTVEKEVDGIKKKGMVKDVDCFNRTFKVEYENGDTEHLYGQEIIPLKKADHIYPQTVNVPLQLNTPCQHPGCQKKAVYYFEHGVDGEDEITQYCFSHKLQGMQRARRQLFANRNLDKLDYLWQLSSSSISNNFKPPDGQMLPEHAEQEEEEFQVHFSP